MPSGTTAIIIWVAIFIGIFYFLAIRPQQRQKKSHAEMERMLKKGDEVVTIAGMYGTISRIGDDWVELEIAKRTKARFMKRAIASIVTIAEEEEEDEEIIEPEDDETYEEEVYEDEDTDEVAEEGEESESPSEPPAPKA